MIRRASELFWIVRRSRSLRELYGSLSTQQPLNGSSPKSPSSSLSTTCCDGSQARTGCQARSCSADQGLQAVPYAALHDGDQCLGERVGLALTPSLTLTPLGKPQADAGAILALGASRFEGLAPLPLVPAELQGVVRDRPSEVLLYQAFTPESLLNPAADPRYGRVHVATHAEFLRVGLPHPGCIRTAAVITSVFSRPQGPPAWRQLGSH